jgi:hypothetical protein
MSVGAEITTGVIVTSSSWETSITSGSELEDGEVDSSSDTLGAEGVGRVGYSGGNSAVRSEEVESVDCLECEGCLGGIGGRSCEPLLEFS